MSKKRWVSVAEFAKQTGYSPQRVYKLIEAGKIKKENLNRPGVSKKKGLKKGKVNPRKIKMLEALQDIANSLMTQNRQHDMEHVKLPPTNKTTPPVGPERAPADRTVRTSRGAAVVQCGFSTLTLAGAQEETARQKAAELKMKNDKAMGKLIDAEEAEKQAFDCARLTRDAILSVPDRMAAELASITDVHEINDRLTRELTQALEDLGGLMT